MDITLFWPLYTKQVKWAALNNVDIGNPMLFSIIEMICDFNTINIWYIFVC